MEWIGKYQNLWKKIGIAAAVCLGMKYLGAPGDSIFDRGSYRVLVQAAAWKR